MAKKHWILIATVAAGVAVGAPAAMAAPELPGVPALPGLPAAPMSPPSEGACTEEPGAADASSDQPALQLPVAGVSQLNENCASAGNEQGNGLGGGGAFPQ